MTNTYYLSNNDNDITIAVTISTPGVGYSEADKEVPGGASVKINDSSDNVTGSIIKTVVAKADQLDGCSVEVDTIVDLDAVDPALWQSCFDNIKATYFLTGGINGDIQFGCDDDDKKKSKKGNIITIAKIIHLTIK